MQLYAWIIKRTCEFHEDGCSKVRVFIEYSRRLWKRSTNPCSWAVQGRENWHCIPKDLHHSCSWALRNAEPLSLETFVGKLNVQMKFVRNSITVSALVVTQGVAHANFEKNGQLLLGCVCFY